MSVSPKEQEPMYKRLREVHKGLKRVKEQIEEIIRPTARFTRKLVPGMATKTWQMTDMSTDPDGSIVGWLWQVFRNDVPYAQSTEQHPQFALDNSYEYRVKLTVTDSGGLTDNTEQVIPAVPVPPVDTLVYEHNFNDGTIGVFTQWGGYTPQPVTVIDDPTGSGRGKVAKIVYERDPAGGGSRDVNGGLYVHPNPVGGHPEGVGFGDRIYFQGDFYIPSYSAGNTPSQLTQVQRKLTYLKFGTPALRTGGLFPVLWERADGSGMYLSLVIENNVTGVPTNADGLAVVTKNSWYRLGLELVVNHQGVADGAVRLWLKQGGESDVLIYERIGFEVFVPGLAGTAAFIYEWGIGNQEQWGETDPVAMKDYRLWDNIEFHTQRPVGP